MTDKIVIFVTVGRASEARTIARHLVEARLAACVNLTAPIESIYRWEGKLASDKEFLLIIKTARDLFERIRMDVARLHSYTTPEIISLPIIDGSADYLQWIENSVTKVESH